MFSFGVGTALKVAVVLAAAGVGIGSYRYFKMPDDNPIEECAEYVIRQETGLDIDLSFTSQERNSCLD